jgi:epoxyqueuosine reductase
LLQGWDTSNLRDDSNVSHAPFQPAAGPVRLLGRERTRALALEAGFSEAGLLALPHANDARDAARFEEWLQAGRAGSMQYLKRDNDAGRPLRSRVNLPFPWARSVIVCMANYNSVSPRSIEPAPDDAGWIARYAWTGRMETSKSDASKILRPSDYHKVLKRRLKSLEARLHGELGNFEARAFVDTGPLVERSLATAAGLGWTGKNTCLIHPTLGSYSFLAALLTSLEAEDENALALPDRCGSCRRCLEACPTGALIAPYQMDASRCIAYLTIEHRGSIAPELMEGMGRQLFGCDICQDVCPWNRKSPISADPELEPRPELVNPALEWLAAMDEAEYERRFNGSPVRRAGFSGLRRNLAIAMGNSKQARCAVFLKRWASDADDGLRTAARWAINKLSGQ